MFKTNLKLATLNNSLKDNSTTKDQTPDSSLLVKEGYITKLKSKKRRYFVLYTDNDNESARLDYYENEKKFRTSPQSFKRSIILKDCFGVIKKHDPLFKKNNQFVFAIYTRDDCFSLLFDNEEEMNNWFSFINEIHFKSIAKSNMIHDYDKIWFVIIKDKKSIIRGSFYLCLTEEEIHLFKINNSKENRKSLNSSIDQTDQQTNKKKLNSQSSINDKNESTTVTTTPSSIKLTNHYNKPIDKMESFRFPFSLIRGFGHQSNSLFIELGRSSDLGSCKLWFELKDCDTSQYIHSLVANTRTASKNEFRTRSNSENNRMFTRQNKSSISDKQNVNSTSISQSNTTTSINQQLNKLSSNSLKLNNNQKLINCDRYRNEKDNSTEYVEKQFFSYSPVNLLNNFQIRTRSTSESSSSKTASIAQNIYKSKNSHSSNLVSSSSNILSNESIQSIEEDNSDYYMTTPGQRDLLRALPTGCIKEEDYLVVGDGDELIDNSCENYEQFQNKSPTQLNSKLEDLKAADLQLVSTANARSYTFSNENAQHYKKIQNAQHYQPMNSSFVDLQDPVEELNEIDQVDEYIQVEFNNTSSNTCSKKESDKKSSSTSINTIKNDKDVKSTEISIDSSQLKSTLKPLNESIRCINNNQLSLEEEEDDYIGVESFSSTNNTATNQESENFENSNLSPISSASCNTNRVKTFSTSSNNTSNNELNSLGTSPSLLSNTFYNTPINHTKEDAHKLDNVKSHFNSTEDCDYIKPARTYSMGSRRELTSHKIKLAHGPTMSNSLILNKKVPCGHFSNDPNCNHLEESTFMKDNRVRAHSMGSHSTVRKDLLKKIRLNQKLQENTIIKQNTGTLENGEMDDLKCLSTPILINKDYTRNRSATFTSIPNSSRTSSKKTVNEEESSEDDLMTVEFGGDQSNDLSKSVPRFESYLIKDKLKELSLANAVESKAKD